MSEKKVKVFFYGSFINRQVLAKGGLVPSRVQVARLWGYDIHAETLATLIPSDEHSVYGILCDATHSELRQLYGQDWLGGTYLPEAVLVETEDRTLVPALCYIAPKPPPTRPADDYLDWIIGPAREYGFPEWYIKRIEHFRK
jgi:AIG2 family protein